MSSLTIQDPFATVLSPLLEPVEIRDARGKLLGHFIPTAPLTAENLTPRITLEEMARREQLGGGRTLEKIQRDWAARS